MAEFAMDTDRLARVVVDLSKVPEGVFNLDGVEGLANAGEVVVVSWFPPDVIRERGLPPEAICGMARSAYDALTEDSFVQNRAFVDLLHRLNESYVDPELVRFAQTISDPGVAVIDERSPDIDAAIPSEDILGHYSLADGAITGYHANPNYRLMTSEGIFKLNPWLRRLLVAVVLNEDEPLAE